MGWRTTPSVSFRLIRACGSQHCICLAGVALSIVSAWPEWLSVWCLLGRSGSQCGVCLAGVALSVVSAWPEWLSAWCLLGRSGSQCGVCLAGVAFSVVSADIQVKKALFKSKNHSGNRDWLESKKLLPTANI